MIINRIQNTDNYLVKILNKTINIYNRDELESITKNIFTKIIKKDKLRGHIKIDFYFNKLYGIVILLNTQNKLFSYSDEIEVKITIHTDTPFLYKIDYFNIIENKLNNQNIYYYQKSFYLEIKNKISTKKYYNILERSEIIYNNSYSIINDGIKINI